MKRWFLRSLSALALLLMSLICFVAIRSDLALRETYALDEPELKLPDDAGAQMRGRHIAITRGCSDCHADDLGGRVIIESAAIGRMAAPNLTRGRGGIGAALDASAWERAIRHGIRRDGRGALFMPIGDFVGLSDADTADLIAYAQSVPPVDRAIPDSIAGPLVRVLFAFGQMSLLEARAVDHRAVHPVVVTKDASPAFGRYLAQSCTGCHGTHFSGGRIPGTPPSLPAARNLTPDASGLQGWSRADFARAVREGRRPDGSALNPFMPAKAYVAFDDVELDALWAYLSSLPPRPAGQR